MARIAGINLPKIKESNTPYRTFMVGLPLAQKILREAKIDFNIRTDDLTEEQTNKLREIIERI